MNFLELNFQMLEEAIELRNRLKGGLESVESYCANMGGLAQVAKMLDQHMRIIAFEHRFKTSLRNVGKNMIGYNPETENVRCLGAKKGIARSECLDWSGQNPPKYTKCNKCLEFGPTRKILLG